jgi:ferredoxin
MDENALAWIEVDGQLCSATANCVAIAPSLFELGKEDDVARPLIPALTSDAQLALADEAAECCPLTAITVHRTRNGGIS